MENTEEIWKCDLCDLQKDNEYYPQIDLTHDEKPRTQLRCGHIFHTHCMFHAIVYDGIIEIDAVCPNRECNTTILHTRAVEFYNRRRGNEHLNIERLWRENETFRNDLKDIFKVRKDYLKSFKLYSPKVNLVRRKFRHNIKPYMDAIKYEKSEFKKEVHAIPEKTAALRSMNKYGVKLNKFLKKYELWTSDLRHLRGLEGAPNIPMRGSIGIKYSHRYGLYKGNMRTVRV